MQNWNLDLCLANRHAKISETVNLQCFKKMYPSIKWRERFLAKSILARQDLLGYAAAANGAGGHNGAAHRISKAKSPMSYNGKHPAQLVQELDPILSYVVNRSGLGTLSVDINISGN